MLTDYLLSLSGIASVADFATSYIPEYATTKSYYNVIPSVHNVIYAYNTAKIFTSRGRKPMIFIMPLIHH